MAKQAQPIPKEVYECPKCNKNLFTNLEEAKKHVNVPIYGLPIGFVFYSGSLLGYPHVENSFINIVLPGDAGVCKDDRGLHGIIQQILPIEFYNDGLDLFTQRDIRRRRKKLLFSLGFKNPYNCEGVPLSFRMDHTEKGWDYWKNADAIKNMCKEDPKFYLLNPAEFIYFERLFYSIRRRFLEKERSLAKGLGVKPEELHQDEKQLLRLDYVDKSDLYKLKTITGIRLQRNL